MFPSTPPLSARFLLVRIFMVAGERRSSCFVLQKLFFRVRIGAQEPELRAPRLRLLSPAWWCIPIPVRMLQA